LEAAGGCGLSRVERVKEDFSLEKALEGVGRNGGLVGGGEMVEEGDS